MTENEKIKFDSICLEQRNNPTAEVLSGIGTYGEKAIHKAVKSFAADDSSAFEVNIGPYVADVVTKDVITEIQTKNFKYLLPKIKYYLENTDYKINVIYPAIAENTVIRMDKETGEILRKRRSSAHRGTPELLSELYYLRDIIPNERLSFQILFIRCEEYRYSERMRYRKKGAYDSELFPVELLGSESFSKVSDFERFLPSLESFDASEYAKFINRKGRTVYSSLNFLCGIGLLDRKKEGKKYSYFSL